MEWSGEGGWRWWSGVVRVGGWRWWSGVVRVGGGGEMEV